MLQEAQNDPPEPGNLIGGIVLQEQEHENHNVDQPRQHEHAQSPQSPQVLLSPSQPPSPPPIIQHTRNEETAQTYLMLATMLKYLNNGRAFAENHLED